VTALIAAVFLASLLGSLHCAGMCGGLMAFAVGLGGGAAHNRRVLHIAYHSGRLATYTLLGAVAGTLGAALDLGGGMVGIQRTAAALAGAVIIGFGIIALLKLKGVHIGRLGLPGFLQRWLVRAHRMAMDLPPFNRALVIGLLTTLLPCGWLYAFAITAAGTAHPLWGALTMAVFWAGTLPVLVALGTGVQLLMGVLGKRLPMVTAIALIAVGVFTVAERLLINVEAFAVLPSAAASQSPVERVRSLDSSSMPCCALEEKFPEDDNTVRTDTP
jgi:uncharacterized protein